MKKLLTTSLFILPALVFAAVDATVVQSGSWGNSATWQDGELPAVAEDGQYNITFAQNDLNFTIGSGGTYKTKNVYIQFADNVNKATITSVNTGGLPVTLYFGNLTSGDVYLDYSSGDADRLRLSNEGSVKEGVNIHIQSSKVYTSAYNPSGFKGTLYVDAGSATDPTSDIVKISRLSGSGNLVVQSGAALKATQAMNLQNDSILTMYTGSYFETAQGIKMQNADISGHLNVTGARPKYYASDSTDLMICKKAVFREGSKLTTLNTNETSRSVLYGSDSSLYSYAGAGKLSFAQDLMINGGTLVLNSQNAITNSKGEQNVVVSNYHKVGTSTATDSTEPLVYGKSTATIKIGVDADNGSKLTVAKNTIDNLSLYDGSTLNLYLNGNELEIVNLIQKNTTGNSEKFGIVIYDDIMQGDLIVQDFNKLTNVDDVKGYLSVAGDMAGKEYFVEKLDNGYFSIYTTAGTVPEPAELAIIFGVLALGFVAYKRRK